ncbi:MAG: hypothetical protein KKF41_08595 [Actinobacteria bacterium]|nr:hypothetical protein [Actinomycetota bacterium]MBU1942900.1 hypothetical protein [Actinomycetota bacterium]MBU2687632.1 hypothetical protein [Actinomycetota bacterium]
MGNASDERAAAVGKAVSILLNGRDSVQDFRREVLRNNLVAPGNFITWRQKRDSAIRDRLNDVATGIVKSYPAYEELDVEKFIVTGELAPMQAIKPVPEFSEIVPGASRITLIIDPRCSAKEVSAAYAETKKLFFSRYPGPKRDRAIDPKYLALAEFAVLNRYDKKTTTWEDLYTKWDQEVCGAHPDWTYGQKANARTNFPRDVRRAIKSVAGIELDELWAQIDRTERGQA